MGMDLQKIICRNIDRKTFVGHMNVTLAINKNPCKLHCLSNLSFKLVYSIITFIHITVIISILKQLFVF